MRAEAVVTPGERHAVLDVLTDLSWALDTGDADRFAGTFTVDADFVLEAGSDRLRIAGRDELVADFRARQAGAVVGTQHRLSNHLFTAGADGECTVWSYWFTSVREPETGEAGVAGTGWICDRLRRTPEGWQIAHHHVGLWRERMAHPLSGDVCC